MVEGIKLIHSVCLCVCGPPQGHLCTTLIYMSKRHLCAILGVIHHGAQFHVSCFRNSVHKYFWDQYLKNCAQDPSCKWKRGSQRGPCVHKGQIWGRMLHIPPYVSMCVCVCACHWHWALPLTNDLCMAHQSPVQRMLTPKVQAGNLI